MTRASKLQGTIRPPSDKSLTHRAYIFAALARDGCSEIIGPLEGEDCRATLAIVEALGAGVERFSDRVLVTAPHDLRTPIKYLDCGNSGTTMRLMAGVLAGRVGVTATLVGDDSLSRRPMGRVVTPLRQMGANIIGETAPLTIVGSPLHRIDYTSPVSSGQIKSCLLLAGLQAEGTTWVTEPSRSRDHTERMLTGLGVQLHRRGEFTVGVEGGATWPAFRFAPPADVSSAAFFLCGATMLNGSEITLEQMSTNPTRTGVLDVLRGAGAAIELANESTMMGEPFADITISPTDNLRAFTINGTLVPRLIDEIPVLAVLATQCVGTTKIRDSKEMRVKETDRIEKMAEGLRAMGAQVETYEDGMDIEGPTPLTGTEIDAKDDHRIAMAFAIAGLVAKGETVVHNADSILSSYPDFVSHLHHLSGTK